MALSALKSEWLKGQFPEIAGSAETFDGPAFKGAALAIKGISDLSTSGATAAGTSFKPTTLDA